MADVYDWRQIVTLLATGYVEDLRLGTLTANIQGPVPARAFSRQQFTCCRKLRLTTSLQTIDLGAERLHLPDALIEPVVGDESKISVAQSEGIRWQRYLMTGDAADVSSIPWQVAPIEPLDDSVADAADYPRGGGPPEPSDGD